MDKYIGRLLDNRYEILEVIGTGGMAVVYKARCHRLNRLVAIKILKDDYLQDEEFRRRFHAESQAVAMLSHPNIVSVYDVSTSDEADYIVMELIDGISLKQYMEKKGVLNWKETLHFALLIAKALDHAHGRGIVHRDIKPHNVMVLKNGSVKVADFGIARMMSKGNTLTKEALGSVHYISPEQAKGGRVDNRSDIYSLGVVMYEMMTGRPPYDGESPVAVAIQHINGGAAMPSTINPNIPGGLEQIIMKAMAHAIDQRYETAAAMLADMDEFRKNPAILFDYNTPPTDVVTMLKKPQVQAKPEETALKTTAEQVVRKQNPQRRRPSGSAASQDQKAKKPPQRRKMSEEDSRSRVATIAIISCSAVMVIAIVIFMFVLFQGDLTGEKLYEVPELVGKDFNTLTFPEHFEVKVQDTVENDLYPEGYIISQEPKGGEKAAAGNTIWIKVSRGKYLKPDQIRDLQGKTKLEAQQLLANMQMNLDITFHEEFHDTIAKGNVVRTDPVAGTKLTEGQSVKVYISLGKKENETTMPRLTGNAEEAIKALQRQNLDLDIKTEPIPDSKIPIGEVVRTEPVAGQQIKTGDKVTIYVSSGPKTAKIRDLTGWTKDAAWEYLDSNEFENIQIKFVQSDQPENIVVNQSHKGDKVEVTETIILEVSAGDLIEKTLSIPLADGMDGEYEIKITLLIEGEDGAEPAEEMIDTLKVNPDDYMEQTNISYTVYGRGTQKYNIYIDGSNQALTLEVDFTTP